MQRLKKSKKIICIILIFIILFCVRHIITENTAFYTPKVKKTDIAASIYSQSADKINYQLIFEQTGLSPYAAKKLIDEGNISLLAELQNMYFAKPEYRKNYIMYPFTLEERNTNQTTPIPELQTGDILVTFNTRTLDWRHGHAALVVDAENGIILEHMAVGQTSCLSYVHHWGSYPAFAVLRYPDENVAASAAQYALEHLLDIEYNIFAGIVKKDKSDEDKPESSHCSHIVWQAYKAVGADIDSDRGIIVTPRNIALSENLNVIQIYGLNPDEYANRLLE